MSVSHMSLDIEHDNIR